MVSMIDHDVLYERMGELNRKLELSICNLDHLEDAMCRDTVGCTNGGFNGRECCSDALAELGRSVLDLVISEVLYAEGKKGRRIAEVKRSRERESLTRMISMEEGIDSYVFGEGEGDMNCIEAIIGAKLVDSDYYACREWIDLWLRPRMVRKMGHGIEKCPGREERKNCILR